MTGGVLNRHQRESSTETQKGGLKRNHVHIQGKHLNGGENKIQSFTEHCGPLRTLEDNNDTARVITKGAVVFYTAVRFWPEMGT